MDKRDKVRIITQSECKAVLTRASDSAPGKFLSHLAHDIEAHPERLQAIDTSFAERITSLVSEVDVDLDAPLKHD